MTTKVKKDEHGLYVRAGGYLFRPIACLYNTSGVNPMYRRDGTSEFPEDSVVTARHRGGTVSGTVKADGISEIWFSHGPYAGKKTADCWNPERIL